jgi:hypothetical protein
MVDIPRSSFIPKETSGLTPDRVRRGRTFHVFGFVGTAILVGSLLSAGIVYFLRTSASNDLEQAKLSLNEQKGLFEPGRVSEIREFDRRLQAAEILLKNHVSPSRIFAALEEKTKHRIQFTAFGFERTSESEALVTLAGKTEEFKTLALQEQDFENDAILKNVAFSEVGTEAEGESGEEAEGASAPRGIVFTLTGNVESGAMQYDGRPLSMTPQTHYIEVDNTLVAVDSSFTSLEGGAVLGESITNDSL